MLLLLYASLAVNVYLLFQTRLCSCNVGYGNTGMASSQYPDPVPCSPGTIGTSIGVEGDGEKAWASMNPHEGGKLGKIKFNAAES